MWWLVEIGHLRREKVVYDMTKVLPGVFTLFLELVTLL